MSNKELIAYSVFRISSIFTVSADFGMRTSLGGVAVRSKAAASLLAFREIYEILWISILSQLSNFTSWIFRCRFETYSCFSTNSLLNCFSATENLFCRSVMICSTASTLADNTDWNCTILSNLACRFEYVFAAAIISSWIECSSLSCVRLNLSSNDNLEAHEWLHYYSMEYLFMISAYMLCMYTMCSCCNEWHALMRYSKVSPERVSGVDDVTLGKLFGHARSSVSICCWKEEALLFCSVAFLECGWNLAL